jgi:hypothetical protein
MQAARPSLQIEALCVQMMPHCVRIEPRIAISNRTSSLTRKLLATTAALGNEI